MNSVDRRDELKAAIMRLVLSHYSNEKTVPSVGMIVQQLRGVGLTRSEFYSLYPNGLGEVARAAGVPLPKRLEQTRKALQARERKSKKVESMGAFSTRLVLTEEQTKRFLGISHLEEGKDPLLIVDELLDRDSKLRKTYKLSFSDTTLVASFLRAAVERGWSVSSNPNIISCVTDLWNRALVQNLPPETINRLIGILNDLKISGWDPSQFVKEATSVSGFVHYHRQYKRGLMGAQEFQQRMAAYL